jgi:tetratricopeptide (TPR) repeat protein
LKQSIEMGELLVAQNPNVAEFLNDLASGYNNLGAVYLQSNRESEAIGCLQRSVQTRKVLVERTPNIPKYAADLIGAANNLGTLLVRNGEQQQAIRLLKDVIALGEPAVRGHTGFHGYQYKLAVLYCTFGDALAKSDTPQAIVQYQAAFELLTKLHDRDPIIAEYGLALAQAGTRYGKMLVNTQEWDRALDCLDRADLVVNGILDTNPDNPGATNIQRACRMELARALDGRARHLATSPTDDERNGNHAIDDARRACELTAWKNPRYLDTLACAYAEAGDFQRAIEQLEIASEYAAEDYRHELQQRRQLFQQQRTVRQHNESEPSR